MSWILANLCFLVAATIFASGMSLPAQEKRVDTELDRLVAAYPDALSGHDFAALRWRDGTVMPVTDDAEGKMFAEILRHPSIVDQMRIPYPRGPLDQPPAPGADPGRFRNAAFFRKMYGDCRTGEVLPHLVSLKWLPRTWGHSISITSINGVDNHLAAVSAEIDALPQKIKRAAYPVAGTYNCRPVADTGEMSPHAYGIAIDLNLAFSDYWYWRSQDGTVAYRNRMPEEIVTIFEKHGFIWGGKWYHFDTMHFEFRPEVLSGP
jgi:D-alanyl-D-alanine carboxypeptidase